jgi:adenine-specific DNA-methyltransferase
MANVKGGRYVASLYYGIVNPTTGEEHFPSSNGNWRFNKSRIAELMANDEIYFGEDGRGRPKLKRFLSEVKDGITYPTIWDFVPLNTAGSSEMAALLGNMNAFDNPKPRHLLTELIKLGCTEDGIVLDFFAGSGTTGDAVYHANLADSGTRKFILVQLPQPPLSGDFKSISEITVRRLRAAADELRSKSMNLSGDMGFRVFKLDITNVRPWDPTQAVTAETLPGLIDNILSGRTESDLLYELLLKRGLSLTVPIETKTIANKTVYAVGAGTLISCLAPSIAASEVETLAGGIVAWHKELAPDPAPNLETPKAKPPKFDTPLVVFRDSAFVDDVAKSNLTEILKQHGLTDVRSL